MLESGQKKVISGLEIASHDATRPKGTRPFSSVLRYRQLIIGLLLAAMISFLTLHFQGSANAADRLKLATTTSTDNSGLLGAILPAFEKKSGLKVDVIAVGTGKALKLGENGDVDVVLVHAPEAEKKFVKDGFGVCRRDVMYNDFIILGPSKGPAVLKASKTAVDAMKKLSETGATFVSRGDDSGTDKKEKELWRLAGIKPQGKWYLDVGKGMEETIFTANELGAYTLSDRGTYLALKEKVSIRPIYEGDPALFNPYGVIAVNPARHQRLNYSGAKDFINWIISAEGQTLIGGFKKYGEALFHPSAKGAAPCE